MTNDIAIKIENLSKVYKIFDKPIDRMKEALHPFHKRYSKDFYALKNISFTLKKGETLGIIGKNGAGKSTLLKIITGVLTPSSGKIQVNGRIASLLELGAGFNPEMTGVENIYMNGTLMGYSKEEMDKRIDNIVSFADIGDFINQPVKMYSSGMFARLAFAVNAFVEPDILIVDEALSVGDNAFQIKCMRRMKELMEGGTTILFVSHDINAIRRFCTKAVWINDGTIKLMGDVNWVVDKYVEFLKIKDVKVNKKKLTVNNTMIAEILDMNIYTNNGILVDEVSFDMPIFIEVKYNVLKNNLKNVVLGIALRSIDDEYICGLNTLLDKKNIPWNLGVNSMILKYPMGLRVLGGEYYFDVALIEETATIPIQYLSRAKKIKIKSDYKGEGIFIIPHDWLYNKL